MTLSINDYDRDQILYCCTLSQLIVRKLGLVNRAEPEAIPIPLIWESDINYEILQTRLPSFLRSIGTGSDSISKDDFTDKYGELEYSDDDDDGYKREVVDSIISLFEDIEAAYYMAGLLNIPSGITGRNRAVLGSKNFFNDNGEQMDKFFASDSDGENDELYNDLDQSISEVDKINSVIQKNVRTSVYVGDREVDFKLLRVICTFSGEYIIIADGGSNSDYQESRLLSNVTNSSFSNFINSFVFLGTYKNSMFDDFSTLITLFVQGFADEISDGSLKTKSNFRSTNMSRQNLVPNATKQQIENVNNGFSYWQALSWFGVSGFNLNDYKIWCEECFSKLVIYLDLLHDVSDDTTPFPGLVPNQNIKFRTINVGIKLNDIRMAAASCELNRLFSRKFRLRDQVRSLVSYLMILVANDFTIIYNKDDIKILEWTLFPLSTYSKIPYLTNINYKQLYSILKVLMIMIV